jgi:hypothetical protein
VYQEFLPQQTLPWAGGIICIPELGVDDVIIVQIAETVTVMRTIDISFAATACLEACCSETLLNALAVNILIDEFEIEGDPLVVNGIDDSHSIVVFVDVEREELAEMALFLFQGILRIVLHMVDAVGISDLMSDGIHLGLVEHLVEGGVELDLDSIVAVRLGVSDKTQKGLQQFDPPF